MTGPFISAGELAATLQKSTRTIYRMTHAREIPFLKVGGEYRYDLDAVIAKLSEPAPAWKQSKRSTSRKRVA